MSFAIASLENDLKFGLARLASPFANDRAAAINVAAYRLGIMGRRLLEELERIETCATLENVIDICDKACRDRGIVAQSYTNIPPIGDGKIWVSVAIHSQGFAPEFVKIYGKKKWYLDDPFIKHAFRTSSVVWWADIEKKERRNPDYKDFFATMRALVEGDGLSVPAFGPNNANGYFALATGTHERDISPEALKEIQTICQAIHLRYCQLATLERKKCDLSSREIETMRHLIRGMTTSEIAEEMELSTHTVNTYLKRAFEKLEVNDRVSAALRFLALGYAFL